ncbi:probable ATP-dependent RNA helicase spindle-E [Diachasma alloeum]|uniref:probable ATP-dependent RNA helicase spindle-E n=1 Tax=Diachasma alloeum TaxID=454923 RepID=UPI00073813D0|nr:probable ATP-dependent RNA helicase spindle-E [Diachasma alloeum]
MDDPMAFFYGKAPMKTVVLHKPARKSYKLSTDVASLCCASETSTLSTCVGTDYADEYLEREDQLLRESSALYRSIPGPEGGSYDQISLTTAASNVHLDEEQAKIYNTYDLSYTPRNHLSIASFQDQITIMIETNPVTIIQGPTGCGKTTQVPQFILDSCYRKKLPCNIVVTQPRRIAAMSIAKRVSEEHEWPCGTLVGFKVGLVSNTNEETRLTYCTTGVLLQRLVHQKHMNDFTHVIIDEIHERDQDMDFLLLVVRKFLRSNSRGVRVVLMSATFNVEKFSKYFSFYAGQKLISAPIIDVTKRNLFLIREFYLDDLHVVKTKLPEVKAHEPEVSKEMLQFAASLMKLMNRIDEEVDRFGSSSSTDRPTILVFLPGIHEIEELHNLLDAPMNESDKWDIVVLHSSITSEEQGRIFEAPPPGYRRIILSTNIAESSLTVPNVKYIIDFCLTKQLVTDPTTNFHSLELTWASHANCQQRAGRTGRVMDGRVYRLVPKLFYQQVLPAENPPEIARAPLENIYLRAKMLNMDKPKALLALSLDPPDLSNITRTVLNLKEAGALLDVGDDPHDGELTDMGRVMGQLPLEIHVSKLIILGHVFSVLREAIIIGASMSVKNMFSAPFKEKMQAYRAKLLWARNTNSDGIAFLNAFKAFMNFKFQNSRAKDPSSEHAWARRSFLQIRVMREVEATVNEITQRLESLGIKETRGPLKIQWNPTEFQFVLKVIIAGAFYPQYYLAHPRADERSSVKELGGLDPTKTVYLTGWPFSQPGQLYAKRFQEAFQEVLSADSSRIGVKFDHSNRVYIQFNKTEVKDQRDMPDLPGDIPVSVYQALKLKSIGNAITIPLMPADAANKMAEELGVEKDPINLYLPRPRRTPNGPAFRLRPELPPLDLTYFPIEIQRIVDPGRFWVTNKDEQTRRNLSKIKKIISAMDAKGLESFETNPKVGTVVLAPKDCTMDDKSPQLTVVYDRAVIQNLFLVTRHEYNAQVFFIDSGFVSKLRISDLRCVPVDSPLEQIPAAALQCVLSHVKPAILNTLTGQWSEGAKRVFEELITGEEKKLYAEVYSVVNSVASIYLHVYNNKSETIQVNDFLVREGYAECREEDYLSKANHNIREDVNKLSIDEKNTHTELQHSQLYLSDSYVEPPDVVDCPITVTLTGPNSPLEVKLSNLIGAGVGLSIGIDPVSVNCVLLDPTLNDPQARLVVAGSVSQGFCSGNLTLRNTTLMPNIPGLTHLLALIFAPRVELRANSMKTRNVGALCGLGHEKDSKRSLFPEHDMTLNFDVDINLDDLQNINRLRYWMSMGIFVNTDEDKDEQQIINDTIKAQTKVKESLFTLMSRKRDPIMAEVDLRHGKWCRYKDSEFIDPPNVNKFENIMIYKLHRALDLKQQDDAREGMLIHLEELKRKASMKVKDMPYEEMECLLCTQKISGILHLRTHITSSYHCMLEKQLMEANEL